MELKPDKKKCTKKLRKKLEIKRIGTKVEKTTLTNYDWMMKLKRKSKLYKRTKNKNLKIKTIDTKSEEKHKLRG